MEETVELRELISIVWKGKTIIIISTVVCMLLAGILSWFVLNEKYESKAMVQVVSGTQDMGIMTNYITAEFKPNVYAERIQNESFMQQKFAEANINSKFSLDNLSVDVEMDTLKSNVTLKYTSNDAKAAQQELKVLMDATKTFMSESIHGTLANLEEVYKVELDKLSPEIATIVEEYNKIVRNNNLPEILMLQMMIDTSGGIVLNAAEQQQTALANIDGRIQNQLIQLQVEIQAKMEEYKKAFINYQSVNVNLGSFTADSFIRVITEPTFSTDPSAPSKMLNLALGLVIGMMLGLGIVFFRAYWKNSTPVN